jgi:hypothetical protein
MSEETVLDKSLDILEEKVDTTNINKDDDINALSDNKVDVEIEPDVKSNNVHVQLCSCSIVLSCFTFARSKKDE